MSAKLKLSEMFLQSDEIIELINNPQSDDLSKTNILMWLQVPDTTLDAGTYICFDLYSPTIRDRLLKNVILRIDIFSHRNSMWTGEGYTRVDKLQSVIDKMLNCNKTFGIDEMNLTSNTLLNIGTTYIGKSLYYTVLDFSQDKVKGTLEYEKQP